MAFGNQSQKKLQFSSISKEKKHDFQQHDQTYTKTFSGSNLYPQHECQHLP